MPEFEYFTDEDGGYRFRLRADNGEIVHTSEAYTRPEDARRGARDLANTVEEADHIGDS